MLLVLGHLRCHEQDRVMHVMGLFGFWKPHGQAIPPCMSVMSGIAQIKKKMVRSVGIMVVPITDQSVSG